MWQICKGRLDSSASQSQSQHFLSYNILISFVFGTATDDCDGWYLLSGTLAFFLFGGICWWKAVQLLGGRSCTIVRPDVKWRDGLPEWWVILSEKMDWLSGGSIDKKLSAFGSDEWVEYGVSYSSSFFKSIIEAPEEKGLLNWESSL